MKLAGCLILFTIIFQAKAQEYFKPIPTQSVVSWSTGQSEPKELVVHYYWATWCGPCAISLEQLNNMQKQYDKKITVYAYSDEPQDVIEKYLKEKFKNKKPPFSYGRIETKEKAQTSELVHWVSSYPYLFITHNKLLVWHGNPTYPKKDFESFRQAWAEGKWTKETILKRNSVDSHNLDKIKSLISERNKYLKQILKTELSLSEKNREVFKNTKNYVYFRTFIRSEVNIMKAHEQLLSHKEFEVFEKVFLEKRKDDFLNASDVFKGSREELFFVARDLLLAEGKLKMLSLAEEITDRAMNLPEEGTTYPDYNFWVKGLLHTEKGEWIEAQKYNDKAIKRCKDLVHCSQFIDIYQDSQKAIASHLKTYCNGFWACSRKAFKNIF